MINQYDMKWGERFAKRRGIYGGKLNLRRRGTAKEIQEWMEHYWKRVSEGDFCPIRAAKVMKHFEKCLEKANGRVR